jgi:hypothetical protein
MSLYPSRCPAGLAAIAALALAGCNTRPLEPEAAAPASRAAYVSDLNFKLPEGGGCNADIARFQALIDNDLASGHVDQSVHSALVGELESARRQCQAGDESRALAMLAVAKKRHGYPA